MIHIYNRTKETYNGKNNYRCFRPSILGNPFTHIKDKETKALYIVRDRDEAVEQYSHYFDVMYSGNKEYRAVIDDMYEKYKRGEDIYLECYCKPLKCHCDIIADKLQKRLVKEKIKEMKNIR